MGATIWVARDRWKDEKGKWNGDYYFYLRKEKLTKDCFADGGVEFDGEDLYVCDDVGRIILRKAGIRLKPGEGPVKVEVSTRRVK